LKNNFQRHGDENRRRKKEKCWDHYYETWMHLVNTYVFMGKVNTGLQEVKKMHLVLDTTYTDGARFVLTLPL
jgi:hypothetical protein